MKNNESLFEKARIIKSSVETMDYDTCKKFDSVYKFNEFKIFKPYTLQLTFKNIWT
jgi:hypothetical protein